MKHVFSVDLEDWYQGVGIPVSDWVKYEKRIHIGTEKLLHLFRKHDIKATFFTLGKVLEEQPELIKKIIQQGHEIACHTYTHPFLYKINQQEFENELSKCEQAAKAFDIRLKGFRAPYFSVDHRSMFVLDSLKKFKYLYDSSIFPGDTKRTGIPGFSLDACELENGLKEMPITKFKLWKFDVGTGGAFFRILPYFIFQNRLKKIAKIRPINFYIHPWELDPEHPKLHNLPARIKYPHYFNLRTTEKKLDKLMKEFSFQPMSDFFGF